MALVNCPECNREISGKATSCPGCGNPMQQANGGASSASGRATFEARDPSPPPSAAKWPAAPQHEQEAAPAASKKTDLTLPLLAVPVVGLLLAVFWVGEMSLLQNPMASLNMVMIFVIVGTASLAAFEASQNGEKADKKAGRYSPTQWFFIVSLIWFIGYPAYMIKRKHQGLKSMALVSILLAAVTTVMFGSMAVVIEEKRAEIRKAFEPLEHLQRQLTQ